MPGPLGRVARPSAGGPVGPSIRLTASDLQLDRLTVRPFDRPHKTPIAAAPPFDRSTVRRLDRPYLTRALTGLNSPDAQEWAKRNHLTPPLFFSHNLANVFPRELYKQHPKFFPLIAGKRLDPPSGPVFWQPDLGREDVARYAADRARQYFNHHPTAETFSLGVNDGLNFGESPETIALLRDGFRGRPVELSNRRSDTDADSRTVEPSNGRTESDLPFDRSIARPTTVRPLNGSTVRPSPVQPSHGRSTARQAANRSTVPPFDRSTDRPPIRYFRGRPDFSPLVFTFMNRAAADLARTDPDKYLGCLAYYWCENTPPFTVDSHVLPFLTADRTQSYDPAFVREEFDLQSRWAAALGAGKTVEQSNRRSASAVPSAGSTVRPSANSPTASDLQLDSSTVKPGEAPLDRSTVRPFDSGNRTIEARIGLYDYLYGSGFLIPRVPIQAIAEHIRHAHEVGFTDYFAELNPNWGLDGPKPWVVAQLLQDPEQNVDRLLETYYTAYFQAAAEPMRRFFNRCEEQWMHQPGPSYWLKHYRNTSQAALFPSDVCIELRALLTQASAQANTDLVRQRVAFVSDAFGVTERFVALCEARDALTTHVLRHELSGAEGERLLADYHQKRRNFFRYSHDLAERCPLAFSPINYADWLRDDPSFAARRELGPSRGRTVEPSNRLAESDLPLDRSTVRPSNRAAGRAASSRTVEQSNSPTDSDLPFDRSTVRPIASAAGGAREVLQNGELAGLLTRGRRITGLQFGIDLPEPWQSRVEPTERGVAVLVDSSTVRPFDTAAGGSTVRPRTRSRVLRLSAQESAIVFTWAHAKPGYTYTASVWTRAQVSPSDVVELVIGWLDAKNQRIGDPIGIRLPEGAWPDWVQLVQGVKAPPGAVWVGIQLLVQHQVGSDWAEARDFSLREISE